MKMHRDFSLRSQLIYFSLHPEKKRRLKLLLPSALLTPVSQAQEHFLARSLAQVTLADEDITLSRWHQCSAHKKNVSYCLKDAKCNFALADNLRTLCASFFALPGAKIYL